MERFARYTFAPWPDAALLEAAARFRMPVVVQVVQNFRSGSEPRLLIEVEDAAYSPTGETGCFRGEGRKWQADPNGIPGILWLTWDVASGSLFALESYDEFYSRPYAHAWKDTTEPHFLHEIISEPDPWIEELLADNPDTGVFPMFGSPVVVRDDLRAQNPSWGEPTGRFFPPTARLEDGGRHYDFFNTSGEPFTPEDAAERVPHVGNARGDVGEAPLPPPLYRVRVAHAGGAVRRPANLGVGEGWRRAGIKVRSYWSFKDGKTR